MNEYDIDADKNTDYVPIEEMSESDLLEEISEKESIILQIETQIADNAIFPRRDETWLIRANAKIYHTRVEIRLLSQELQFRRTNRMYADRQASREAKLKRYEIALNTRSDRLEFFIAAVRRLINASDCNKIWAAAKAINPEHECWVNFHGELSDAQQEEIAKFYDNGNCGLSFNQIADKFNCSREQARSAIKKAGNFKQAAE